MSIEVQHIPSSRGSGEGWQSWLLAEVGNELCRVC